MFVETELNNIEIEIYSDEIHFLKIRELQMNGFL